LGKGIAPLGQVKEESSLCLYFDVSGADMTLEMLQTLLKAMQVC
jgi:hypothetical protein